MFCRDYKIGKHTICFFVETYENMSEDEFYPKFAIDWWKNKFFDDVESFKRQKSLNKYKTFQKYITRYFIVYIFRRKYTFNWETNCMTDLEKTLYKD